MLIDFQRWSGGVPLTFQLGKTLRLGCTTFLGLKATLSHCSSLRTAIKYEGIFSSKIYVVPSAGPTGIQITTVMYVLDKTQLHFCPFKLLSIELIQPHSSPITIPVTQCTFSTFLSLLYALFWSLPLLFSLTWKPLEGAHMYLPRYSHQRFCNSS